MDEAEPSSSKKRKKSIRSNSELYDWKLQCIFCGQGDKFDGKKSAYVLHQIEKPDFESNLKQHASNRSDDWKIQVLAKVSYVRAHHSNLESANVVYHRVCRSNFSSPSVNIPKIFRTTLDTSTTKRGKPSNNEQNEAFLKTAAFFKQNDDGQLTISDLVQKMSEYLLEMGSDSNAYSNRYFKTKLVEKFDQELIVSSTPGSFDVVTLKNNVDQIIKRLRQQVNESKESNAAEQNQLIIEAAGRIIKEEIKAVIQDKIFFPSSGDLSNENAVKFVPHLLRHFLKLIFTGEDTDIRIGFIGQSIMQSCRPRNLICPLQLGLAVQFHNILQSKLVVDELHSAGFCSSYHLCEKFENCAAQYQGTRLSAIDLACPSDDDDDDEYFAVQYMADNVDHNPANLDGKNTLHAMGMMATVTPCKTMVSKIPISNVSKNELIDIAKVDIPQYMFEEAISPSIKLCSLKPPSPIEDITTDIDLLWELSQNCASECPGWFGFMQMIENGSFPGKSSMHYLPIINLDPTNMTCIYSTLLFISKHAMSYKIKPVVTFDQPLYWKALAVAQKSNMSDLVLRLGSFHTLMSFLGTIGKLMQGTGIEKILQLVYGESTVSQMLGGKAVSRGLRAHTLLVSSLYGIIIDQLFPNSSDSGNVETESQDCNPFMAELNVHLREILVTKSTENVNLQFLDKFKVFLRKFKEETSEMKTSVLWFQYLDMLDIVLSFMRAERTGDWVKHINAIKLMLPYLAASGHNNYVKSILVYVQQMEDLSTSHPDVYSLFMTGHHTIWRSNRYWGGLSTDLIIEQCLMRNLKSRGGLTRGRGVTDAQRATWILSAPIISEINSSMQELTKTAYVTSEQHKEAYGCRMKRDGDDSTTIYQFIKDRCPFTLPCRLRNIVTGVSADENVNVEQAKKVGEIILKNLEGRVTDNMEFKQSWQVSTFNDGCKSSGTTFQKLKPLELFQRCIMIAAKLLLEYTSVLKYELTPYPVSLFEGVFMMNEAKKPAFADALWSLLPKSVNVEKPIMPAYVIDGGALLYRVKWYLGQTFESIIQRYQSYITYKYGSNSMPTIIFDGYVNSSPKDSTHLRRTGGSVGPTVEIKPSNSLTMNRKLFLSCSENKILFIGMLGRFLQDAGCTVLYADADADYLTAKTAFDSAQETDTILVGDDTDLLVILIGLTKNNEPTHHLFYCPEPKPNSKKETKVWDIRYACNTIPVGITNNVLFLHALHGCDTTSRLPNLRMNMLWKLTSDNDFLQCATVFKSVSSSKSDIINHGLQTLCLIYGGKITETLNDFCTNLFVEKSKLHSEFKDIENYPPTPGAAALHMQRVYLQIMTWIGVDLDPLEWGFHMKDNAMLPIMNNSSEICPKIILDKIKCGCKTGCANRCSCRFLGIECTLTCKNCVDNCTNKVYHIDDVEETD